MPDTSTQRSDTHGLALLRQGLSMDIDAIERREDISVEDFVRDFMEPNIPVILGSKFTRTWAARQDWVTSDGQPNFSHLVSLFGDAPVQVAECDVAYFSDQKRAAMSFGDFVHQWRTHPSRKLYCKDWHFARSNPGYRAYTPLPHLSDDWINLFYDDNTHLSDDYRFAYMGGHGTWTPFHEDVFRSYSWSANVCGEKHWILVPPGQTHLFTDSMGNWVYNLVDYDEKKFPRVSEVKKLEVVQRAGETVFVPSGWWHQVLNKGDTISINHNWANEFNLHHLYARLRSDLDAVEYALRDVKDMDGFEEQAQVVLKADSGTDYRAFFGFVKHVAQVYVDQACNGRGHQGLLQFDEYFRSRPSVKRALVRIQSVLGLLSEDPATKHIEGLSGEICGLRDTVASAISEC